MIRYKVKGMTCGHCIETVTQAVKRVDKSANVVVDLQANEVQVSSDTTANTVSIAAAIRSAGYRVESWGA